MKWALLALGVFLLVNGLYTRTYGYENPARHCFQMDLIDLVGCFSGPTMPEVIRWAAIAVGVGLMVWSIVRGRRGLT